MLVKCINKKCPHKWDYRGKSKDYICCPKCSYRFKIQRGIEEYNKTMLTYSRNIPDNIVNMVQEEPLFERVILDNGMEVSVEKSISKQFKEAPEDLEEEIECEDSSIKIIPAPDIRILPRKTPLEILEHQEKFN